MRLLWSKAADGVCVGADTKCPQQTHRGPVSLHFLALSAQETRQFRENESVADGENSEKKKKKCRCVMSSPSLSDRWQAFKDGNPTSSEAAAIVWIYSSIINRLGSFGSFLKAASVPGICFFLTFIIFMDIQ